MYIMLHQKTTCVSPNQALAIPHSIKQVQGVIDILSLPLSPTILLRWQRIQVLRQATAVAAASLFHSF